MRQCATPWYTPAARPSPNGRNGRVAHPQFLASAQDMKEVGFNLGQRNRFKKRLPVLPPLRAFSVRGTSTIANIDAHHRCRARQAIAAALAAAGAAGAEGSCKCPSMSAGPAYGTNLSMSAGPALVPGTLTLAQIIAPYTVVRVLPGGAPCQQRGRVCGLPVSFCDERALHARGGRSFEARLAALPLAGRILGAHLTEGILVRLLGPPRPIVSCIHTTCVSQRTTPAHRATGAAASDRTVGGCADTSAQRTPNCGH